MTDDRLDEAWIDGFARKPAAEEERADDSGDNVSGRVSAERGVAAGFGLFDDGFKRFHEATVQLALYRGDFRVTLGSVKDRRIRPAPDRPVERFKEPFVLSDGGGGGIARLEALDIVGRQVGERVASGDGGMDLVELALGRRVLAVEEELLGVLALLARVGQRDGGIGAERELLRLADESLGQPPDATSIGIDEEMQAAAVEQLTGHFPGLGVAQGQIREGISPVDTIEMPTSMPTRARFNRTLANRDGHKNIC